MKLTKLVLLTLICSNFLLIAQNDKSKITIIGNTLEGIRESGKNIRKVIGNVVMTQDNVRITCDLAIQDIDKNQAELIGNVIAVQDTVTIKTQRAFYYGDKKVAQSKAPLTLFDGHITLTANKGFYYFDEDKAVFMENVKLVDTSSTLISRRLTYFNNEDRAIASGDVSIIDNKSIIFADSINHLRNQMLTDAHNNIKIIDKEKSVVITGEILFNDNNRKYSIIKKNAVYTQIDTVDDGTFDTLYIFANSMESFDDSSKKFIARDSVKIIRDDFYSVSNYALMLNNENKIITYKLENDKTPPVMWFEESQLAGDSITVSLKDNSIDNIWINRNAFILSQQKDFPNRYNQISGDSIKLYFNKNELNRTDVFNNVLSIYYLFEDNEPNGLLKSSSERAKLLFQNKKVTDVKLYGSIISEYHPENLVEGKEFEFMLPGFILYSHKPNKIKLVTNISNYK